MFFTYQMATNGQQMTSAWIITLCFCKIPWRCPKIYWLKIHFLYLYWSKDLFGWILSEVLFQKGFYARKPNIPQKQNTFCCIFSPHKIQSKFRGRNAFTNQKVDDLIGLDTSRCWVNSKSLVFFS